MKDQVLITGATGFVGRNLVRELLPNVEKLFLVVREQSLSKAVKQFKDPKIFFISGDIENHHVLDDIRDFEILKNVSKVIHAAASYDLNISKEKSYISNIVGTQNILKLINQLPNVKFYFHISSYVVNSMQEDTYHDEELDIVENSKTDYYSWSKNIGEQLVRSFSKLSTINVIILRPGIVIGSTKDINNFKSDGPYFYLSALIKYKSKLEYLKFLPVVPFYYIQNSPLPFIAVDYLVTWIKEIVIAPKNQKLITYHLFDNEIPNAEDFLKLTSEKLNLPLNIMRIDSFESTFSKLYKLLNIPTNLLKYTNLKSKYVAEKLYKDYPHLQKYKFREHTDVFYTQAHQAKI